MPLLEITNPDPATRPAHLPACPRHWKPQRRQTSAERAAVFGRVLPSSGVGEEARRGIIQKADNTGQSLGLYLEVLFSTVPLGAFNVSKRAFFWKLCLLVMMAFYTHPEGITHKVHRELQQASNHQTTSGGRQPQNVDLQPDAMQGGVAGPACNAL